MLQEIKIVWYQSGEKNCFKGDTIKDSDLLNSMTGECYFSEEVYPRVLEIVSDYGYWLTTIDREVLA